MINDIAHNLYILYGDRKEVKRYIELMKSESDYLTLLTEIRNGDKVEIMTQTLIKALFFAYVLYIVEGYTGFSDKFLQILKCEYIVRAMKGNLDKGIRFWFVNDDSGVDLASPLDDPDESQIYQRIYKNTQKFSNKDCIFSHQKVARVKEWAKDNIQVTIKPVYKIKDNIFNTIKPNSATGAITYDDILNFISTVRADNNIDTNDDFNAMVYFAFTYKKLEIRTEEYKNDDFFSCDHKEKLLQKLKEELRSTIEKEVREREINDFIEGEKKSYHEEFMKTHKYTLPMTIEEIKNAKPDINIDELRYNEETMLCSNACMCKDCPHFLYPLIWPIYDHFTPWIESYVFIPTMHKTILKYRDLNVDDIYEKLLNEPNGKDGYKHTEELKEKINKYKSELCLEIYAVRNKYNEIYSKMASV